MRVNSILQWMLSELTSPPVPSRWVSLC
jgi:hypothetical protein